jgi:folylpolyglutamate synthase/dihydropteroate synthase
MDVAHNGHAFERLLKTVRSRYAYNNLYVVFGTSSAKDAAEIFRLLFDNSRRVYLVEGKHPRAMKIDDLAQQALKVTNASRSFTLIDNGNI